MYPKRMSCIFFQASFFYKEEKSIGQGSGVQERGQSDGSCSSRISLSIPSSVSWVTDSLLFFLNVLRFYLFIFRQKGREGEREGEKYQCEDAS